MFKALKKMFPSDDWQENRSSITKDENWWKKLREGAKVEFGSVPQSSISNAELTIKNTQFYSFDDSSFTSYMLHDGNRLQCQLIVAQQGDQNTYLALSRHLSEDELYRICSQEDVKLLTQPRHLKRLYVREQAMGLDGWLSMRYSKTLDNVRGSKTLNDHERPFDYTLLVSDDNSKAIEVERYHDGRCEIYVTVYRPITDILDISGGSAFPSKRGIADMSNVQHTVSIPTLDESDTVPVRNPALVSEQTKKTPLKPVSEEKIQEVKIAAVSPKPENKKRTVNPMFEAESVKKNGKSQPTILTAEPVVAPKATSEFSRSNANKLSPVSETLKAVADEVKKEFVAPINENQDLPKATAKPVQKKTIEQPKAMPIPKIKVEKKMPQQSEAKVQEPPVFSAYTPEPLKTPAAKLARMMDPVPENLPAAQPIEISEEKEKIKEEMRAKAKAFAKKEPEAQPLARKEPEAQPAARKNTSPAKKPSLAIEDIKREIEAKIQAEVQRELEKKGDSDNLPFPLNIKFKKTVIEPEPKSDFIESLKDNPAAPPADQVVVKRVKQEKIDCDMRVAGKIIDEAVRRDMHLADVMRNVLGLPINASDEVTLHLPLSNEDYKMLGGRYNIPADNRNKIKRRILSDLAGFAGENKRIAEDA